MTQLNLLMTFTCILNIAVNVRQIFNLSVAVFLIHQSIPVVKNVIAWSHKQKMNHFFEPFRMVNSYGKFGRYSLLCDLCVPYKINRPFTYVL